MELPAFRETRDFHDLHGHLSLEVAFSARPTSQDGRQKSVFNLVATIASKKHLPNTDLKPGSVEQKVWSYLLLERQGISMYIR